MKGQLKRKYLDKEGHEVHGVSMRLSGSQTPRAIPYFYCATCDRFIKNKDQVSCLPIEIE